MSLSQMSLKDCLLLLVAGAVGLALSGCEIFSSQSGGGTGKPEPTGQQPEYSLRVGDLVTVSFSGLQIVSLPPDHKERIKEDGTITLHLIGSIVARGKTTGQLQKEIQAAYVPGYYKQQLTVTVKADELFFTVGGEVRKPDRYFYVNGITVVGAIHAAGGFTDFAKENRVELRRANGPVITVNYKKAVGNRAEDRSVFPGDTVTVPKRYL